MRRSGNVFVSAPSNGMLWSLISHATQEGDMLLHAARRGNLSIFEYLVEHGATFLSDEVMDENDRSLVAVMLQRRRDWIDQAVGIVHHWRVPLIAIRVIHEYVVGFNWSAVLNGFNDHMAS